MTFEGTATMPRNFRRQGIKSHDRRTTDLVLGAQVAPIEVDDPYGEGSDDKLVVMRSTRDDPLAKLHSRSQIDEAQYHGGRAFQSDWEKAERGPKAIDPAKEAVDGGLLAEPITEGQRNATLRLNRAMRELGADGSAITQEFLVHRLTAEQIGLRRGLTSERWAKYFGNRIRECLDRLAIIYGFATEAVHRRRDGLDRTSKSPLNGQDRK